MLDRLSHRTSTTGTGRDEVRTFPNLGGGVGRRQRVPAGFESGQIGQIITHESDLLGREPMSRDDLEKFRMLVTDVLVHLVNTQFLHADSKGRGMPSGHDDDPAALSNPGTDGEAIMDVKELAFDSMPVVSDGAVGEDAITIECEQ